MIEGSCGGLFMGIPSGVLFLGVLIGGGIVAGLLGALRASRRTHPAGLLAVDRKLDLLLRHFGIDCPCPFSERVRELAADPGRKIAAIKALREETGMGLKEAKDAIESGRCPLAMEQKVDLLLKHFGIDVPPLLEWQELARDPARKIAAIKAYREATGAGLKEAKDAVEQWLAENGY
jgi:ribosomal protein L7/L12